MGLLVLVKTDVVKTGNELVSERGFFRETPRTMCQ